MFTSKTKKLYNAAGKLRRSVSSMLARESGASSMVAGKVYGGSDAAAKSWSSTAPAGAA